MLTLLDRERSRESLRLLLLRRSEQACPCDGWRRDRAACTCTRPSLPPSRAASTG